MESWEKKMISLGRSDLIRTRSSPLIASQKSKSTKKEKQELGCSDRIADSVTESLNNINLKETIKASNDNQIPRSISKNESTILQSTGDHTNNANKKGLPNENNKNTNKNIMTTLKNLFKF